MPDRYFGFIKLRKRDADKEALSSKNTVVFSKVAASPVLLHKWALTIAETLPECKNGDFIWERYTVEDVFPDVEYIEKDPLANPTSGVKLA